MAEKLLDRGPMGKAVKTYLILIGMATRRETINYGCIASETGVGANQQVGKLCLDPVYQFCQERNFPDLTTIVVRLDTGEPGKGHENRETFYRERERVYSFAWMDYAPPTVEELHGQTL